MVHGLVDVFHGERGSHSERGSRQFKSAAHAELSTPRQCIERVAYEIEAELILISKYHTLTNEPSSSEESMFTYRYFSLASPRAHGDFSNWRISFSCIQIMGGPRTMGSIITEDGIRCPCLVRYPPAS